MREIGLFCYYYFLAAQIPIIMAKVNVRHSVSACPCYTWGKPAGTNGQPQMTTLMHV